MKLKFINLLLASVLLVGSAQVFTSCKDNDADLYVDLKEETITLKQKLDQDHQTLVQLQKDLNDEIAARKGDVQVLTDKLKGLQDQLDALKKEQGEMDKETEKEIEKLTVQIADLTKDIKDNTAVIATLTGDVNKINSALTIINQAIENINGAIGGINGEIDGIKLDLEKIKADIKKNTDDIVIINTSLGEIRVDITNINNQIVDIYEVLDKLGVRVSTLEGQVTIIETTLQSVQNDIQALNDRVGGLENRIGDLENKVDGINVNVEELLKFMNEWKPILPEIQKTASEALALANQNALDIASLQAIVKMLQEQIALGNEQSAATIEAILSELEFITAQLENCATIDELAAATAALQKQAEDYYNASIGYTVYMCAGLRAYIEECMRDVNISIVDINNNLAALEGKVDTSIATLNDRLDKMETAIAEGDLALLQKLNEEIAKVNQALALSIATVIAEYITPLQETVDALGVTVEGLGGQVNTLGETVGTLTKDVSKLNNLAQVLKEGLETVQNDVDDLTKRVEAVEKALEPLHNRIEEVAGRLNGVLIQQTDNAVFGTLNLPLGINSNMLIAYASDDAVDAYFPTTESAYSYDGSLEGLGVAAGEVLPFEGNDEVNCKGAIMERDEETGLGVLGTLYMTVNPANVDLTGKTFNIVNSKGQVIPVQLDPKASDAELNLGYTRGGTNNGFYEAKALINPKDLSSVRFVLNKNFKSTVASIVKDPKSLKSRSTIAQLASAFYAQINGVLPAYGVQASWTESDGTNMVVTSQYGLATATFNPLKLATLRELDGKLNRIPNVPDLSNLTERFDVMWDQLTGKLNIKLFDPEHPFVIDLGGGISLNITIPQVSIDDLDEVEVTVPLKNIEVEVPIDVDVKDNDGVVIGHATGTTTGVIKDATVTTSVDMADLKDTIQDAINKALDTANTNLGTASDEINKQIDSIAIQIQNKVNDMLAGMQEDIDNAFTSVKDFLDNKLEALEKRLSRYTDRVQSIITRLNNILAEPSHYMQPVLLYRGMNGKLGMMSQTSKLPTILNSSVSNPGIMLMPTTYTLETVVPLYQKYVAVTKVWANGDASRTNVPAVQKAANSAEYMNDVVNAQRHLIACPLQKGYTYEILYQGLDYAGKVSGHKYYVCVK